jgi:hypothetical protein
LCGHTKAQKTQIYGRLGGLRVRIPDFDPAKPFYPMVMNYAVQMLGFKEAMAMADTLTVRNMMKQIMDHSNLEGVPFHLTVSSSVSLDGFDLAYPFKNEFRQMLASNGEPRMDRLLTHTSPFEIAGPRPLRCKSQEDGIEFSAEEIAAVYLSDTEKMVRALDISAGILLIAAHEAAKNADYQGPECEFLRHCRNAAAHGGRFHFKGGEPRRPASWRKMILHSGLRGTPLFGLPDGDGLLAPGDPILLLWDIESRMSATS